MLSHKKLLHVNAESLLSHKSSSETQLYFLKIPMPVRATYTYTERPLRALAQRRLPFLSKLKYDRRKSLS